MIPRTDRIFSPPFVRNRTPADIFHYGPHKDGFRHIAIPTHGGLCITSNFAIYIDDAWMNNGTYYAHAGMGVSSGRNGGAISTKNFRLTLQQAEIRAAILTLRKIKCYAQTQDMPSDARSIVLMTDSSYLMNWMETGWIGASRNTAKNWMDFEVFDDLIGELEHEYGLFVKFWHVDRSWSRGGDREARRALGTQY